MPLVLLAIAGTAGTVWLTKYAVRDVTADLTKLAIIAGVGYVAWVNRDKIGALVKV